MLAESFPESANMTALSASLASGNCPRLDVKAAWASPVGSSIAANRGAAAYPITPIAVTVAPTAIAPAAIRTFTIRRWLGRPLVREASDGWIRRNGLVHKGATDSGPAMDTRREERSLGAGPGSFLDLLEKRAHGAQILDVLPAMSAVNKVAQQAFSVRVVQRPVNER